MTLWEDAAYMTLVAVLVWIILDQSRAIRKLTDLMERTITLLEEMQDDRLRETRSRITFESESNV